MTKLRRERSAAAVAARPRLQSAHCQRHLAADPAASPRTLTLEPDPAAAPAPSLQKAHFAINIWQQHAAASAAPKLQSGTLERSPGAAP